MKIHKPKWYHDQEMLSAALICGACAAFLLAVILAAIWPPHRPPEPTQVLPTPGERSLLIDMEENE